MGWGIVCKVSVREKLEYLSLYRYFFISADIDFRGYLVMIEDIVGCYNWDGEVIGI